LANVVNKFGLPVPANRPLARATRSLKNPISRRVPGAMRGDFTARQARKTRKTVDAS